MRFAELPTEIKYMLYFQYILVFLLLGFIFIPWHTMIPTLIAYVVGYNYFLLKRRENAREKFDGLRNISSYTIRDKDYREDHNYSFRSVIPLELQKELPFDIKELEEYLEVVRQMEGQDIKTKDIRVITLDPELREVVKENSQLLDSKKQKEEKKKEVKLLKEHEEKQKAETALTSEEEYNMETRIQQVEIELAEKDQKKKGKKNETKSL